MPRPHVERKMCNRETPGTETRRYVQVRLCLTCCEDAVLPRARLLGSLRFAGKHLFVLRHDRGPLRALYLCLDIVCCLPMDGNMSVCLPA